MRWASRLPAIPAARTLRGSWRFAQAALRASPFLTFTAAGCTLVAAVAPLAGVAAVGAVVGRVPEVIRHGFDSPAGRAALLLAVAVGVLLAVGWGAAALQSAAATALGDRVDFELQRRLMSAVMAPVGIAHLEDARILDLVSVGRDSFRAWLRPGRLATLLSALAVARLMVLGSSLILARFRWPLALAFLALALWTEHESKNAASRAADHHYGESPMARRTDYFYELGVTPGAAKEVRVFGLPGFLLERYERTWQLATAPIFQRGSRRPLVSAAALGAVALAVFAWVWLDAARGIVGLGDATVYAQALVVGLGAVSAAAEARLRTEMALATLGRYEAAMEVVRPAEPPPAAGRPARGAPVREIRFERVSFRYPGVGADVLDGLDLAVPAGRSLAIVGANGAGKTTLVKLLCRLHQPTGGRISIDGQDLADLDVTGWRRQVAAVFQDSVRYELPARSNVGLGFVAAQDDAEGIEAAAAAAGVSGAIAALPYGWETVLSVSYEHGADLSGGEWQKVALARALFAVRHGARVLILDEPAAHLDARAEAQLYERFLAMTAGITTIVISHRFSTVRQAASIVVLEGGRVAEQGGHDELLALEGRYAEMYRLQAARFASTEAAAGP